MKTVRTCILTGYGINADYELKRAFEVSGSDTLEIHIGDLIRSPDLLTDLHILAIPGGFSFGDHLGSGKVLATLLKKNLLSGIRNFIASGKLIIGICNGFQVLVKMGLLPDLGGDFKQETSLIHNDSGKFEDRWIRVAFNPNSPCIWTRNLKRMELPVRHGEGKFIAASAQVLKRILADNLVALRYSARGPAGSERGADYPDNPNGSVGDIAGICEKSGRILGLMPHPEAFIYPENYPRWMREPIKEGAGLKIFKNGVDYIRGSN